MIEQFAIAVFGLAAVFLSQQSRPDLRRWACFAGLAAQPFWFLATAKAEQWGMFANSIIYTAAWCLGVWNFWIVPRREP